MGLSNLKSRASGAFSKELRDALLVQLAMPLTLADLARHRALLCENFMENRPTAQEQLKRLRKVLNN